jgi:hypothetical protein
MIESAFYSALSSAPAVAALVTTPANGPAPAALRIYPLLVPTDSQLPAIDYSFIGGSAQGSFDTRGIAKLRVECNCWGETYSDAVTLRAAVVEALGTYNDGTISIRYLMPHDFFDDVLLQYRACAEFYVMASI